MPHNDNILWIVVLSSIGAGNTTFVKAAVWEPVATSHGKQLADEELRHWKQESRGRPFGSFMNGDDIVYIIGIYVFNTMSNQVVEDYQQLQEQMAGLVLLLDSTNPQSFQESKLFLAFYLRRKQVPFLVVANKQDKPDALPLQEIRRLLQLEDRVKIYPCTATDEQAVKAIVFELVNNVIYSRSH